MKILDFLFLDKDLCYLCQDKKIEKYYLCEDCLDKLDRVSNEFRIENYPTYAIYFYNKTMANLIASYKFNRETSLRDIFGQMIYTFGNENNLFDVDYILPVPSYKKTIEKRGFDHIKLICDYFIEKIDAKYLEDFDKIKPTKAQHMLSKAEREKNLKGAFLLKKDLNGKSVLIIDDIITSGNTVKEIIKLLKQNNVGDIKVLGLASSHRI